MTTKIVYIQKIDFTPEGQTQPIQGTNIFFLAAYEKSAEHVGYKPTKKFIPKALADTLDLSEIGDYEFETDLSGKIKSLKRIVTEK